MPHGIRGVSVIGRQFGALTVTEEKKHHGRWCAVCQCSCGGTCTTEVRKLLNGRSSSCGCTHKKGSSRKHEPEYRAWRGMRERCHNQKNKNYMYYGGRGIVVCAEWRGRGGYSRFISDMGPRPSAKHSIDRIDNDGHYCKSNCRWATAAQQNSNRRCCKHRLHPAT